MPWAGLDDEATCGLSRDSKVACKQNEHSSAGTLLLESCKQRMAGPTLGTPIMSQADPSWDVNVQTQKAYFELFDAYLSIQRQCTPGELTTMSQNKQQAIYAVDKALPCCWLEQ